MAGDFSRALDGRLFATVKEAANLLNLSPNTIRTAIYTGNLKGARMVANGPIRIWVQELAKFICACEEYSLPISQPPRRRKPNRKWG